MSEYKNANNVSHPDVSKLQILDCTIRDGGYINNWAFDSKLVRELYRLSSKAGVDFIELGYWGGAEGSAENYGSTAGIWKYLDEDSIRRTIQNIAGAKIAVMIDFGHHHKIAFASRSASAVDLIRVACPKDKVGEALIYCESLKKKGYLTSLNLMGYSKYGEEERYEVAGLIGSSACVDYVYVADSYGSFFPQHIERYFEPLRKLKSVQLGFHPHNNTQMALANTLEALRIGVDIVDASVFGMGRGAGNLPLECLVAYLQQSNPDRYNVLPVLDLIDSFFLKIYEKLTWGYQLPYMLSGMCDLHPNYATELIKRREFSIEQVWHILRELHSQNETRFSPGALKAIYSNKWFMANPQSGKISEKLNFEEKQQMDVNVPYKDRHKGRDFLVLANGPSLVTHKEQIDKLIPQYNLVVIGANYLGSLYVPNYHVFINERRFKDYVETVHESSNLLLGSNLPNSVIQDYLHRPFEILRFVDRADVDFSISESGVVGANCFTVSVLSIALAYIMGARRVFVVGMDGYSQLLDSKSPSMFYQERNEPTDPKDILEREQECYRFLRSIDSYLHDHGNEGFHILTPTVYERFYKGMDNYLNSLTVGSMR